MNEFVVTTSGKIINLDAIAFITARTPPDARVSKADASKTAKVQYVKRDSPKQLLLSFSAVTSDRRGTAPLAVVLVEDEAADFLDQFTQRRQVDTSVLRQAVLAHRESQPAS